MAEALVSAHSFVRALKAPTDPPRQGWPSKLSISKAAWNTSFTRIPRKAGIILDWLLPSLTRTKTNSEVDCILNFQYWELLADVLTNPGDTPIAPIIARFSIANSLHAIFLSYHSLSDEFARTLFTQVHRSLIILWPRSAHSLDVLSDLLWVSVSMITNPSHISLNSSAMELINLIWNSCRQNFGLASINQKKKISATFSQHINDWLSAIQSDIQGVSTEALYQIGTHILLGVDSPKLLLDLKQNTSCLLTSVFLNDELRSHVASRRCLLKTLPCLYKDYLASLRYHQLVIFPLSSSAVQIHERIAEIGTNFATEVIRYVEHLEGLEDQSQIWNVISEVLIISEQNNVTTVRNGTEWMSYLRGLRQRVLSLTDRPWDETRAPFLKHALNIFACLHRIEPELVDSLLPQVLDRIKLCSPRLFDPAFNLWKQLLSFYSQTRTWHVFIAILQDVLGNTSSLVSHMDPREVYSVVMTSPLLSFTFLEELRNAYLTYISAGQAKAIIENISNVLKEHIEGFSGLGSSGDRRGLENIASFTSESNRFDIDSISFFFAARINSDILKILTRRGMSDYAEDLSVCLIKLDAATSMAFDRLLQNYTCITSKKRKSARLNWSDQCIFTSLLHLSYNLFVRDGCEDGLRTKAKIWSYAKILKTFMKENLMPKLQFEIGRWCIYIGLCDVFPKESRNQCLDTVLDYVEKYGHANIVSSDGDGDAWHTAVALLALLLESYLPILDTFMSQVYLERIIRLLIRQMGIGKLINSQPSMKAILNQLFRTASFWEMQNIKASFQAILEEETSTLVSKHSSIRPDMDLNELKQSMHCSAEDLEYTSNIYKFLIQFPPNYLSKRLRDDLTAKALNADVFLEFGQLQSLPAKRKAEVRVAFAAFLSRCWNEQSSKLSRGFALDPSWIHYVFGEILREDSFVHKNLEGKHAGLLKLILQNAVKGEVSRLEVILRLLLDETLDEKKFISSQSILIVNLIIDGTARSRLAESTALLLYEIHNRLERIFKSAVEQLLQNNVFSLSFYVRTVIEGWKSYLSLSVWGLGVLKADSSQIVSHKLFRRVISSYIKDTTHSGDIHHDILSIVILQNKLCDEMGGSRIMEIVAGYLLINQNNALPACEKPLSRFCKELKLDQYEALLNILGEYLEKGAAKTMLNVALHVSILILKEAPEKSSKISSTYVSRCLQFLFNTDKSQLPSSDTCKIFEFLGFQCSERAVSLKSLDVGEILSVTYSLTDASRDHDGYTSYTIFHAVVSMLDDLVRLRHDLLNSFLSHISRILRRLLLLLRTIRPHLGTKQYRLIADTYPHWVDPSASFRASEGTALARLLTTLMTKTSVRSRGKDRSSESSQATSLARSFARHAPYVLLAYLEAAADPLAYIPVLVRKELQPGLFALCTMAGEHGRDTLMVQNLNTGQKALLKALWGGYARQRYTGRG